MIFSVPIGVERLEFNSHRVFDPRIIISLFDKCKLLEFSVIDDENKIHENVDYNDYINLNYGCGLFYFEKRDDI